jgi:hypothetical protein
MTGSVAGSHVLDLYETFDPPPRGFDVHSAPARALRKHGLPQRPDAASHRRLAQSWQRAFARPPNYVKAELEIDRVMGARDRPLYRQGGEEFDVVNKWAGAVVNVIDHGFGEPVKTVFAQWTMPHVWPYDPDSFSFPITAGFWVGIDGFLEEGAQVLQAGVAVTVPKISWSSPTSPVSPTFWAWTEWWTEEHQDPAVKVSNFPVEAGDTIFVLVCAPEPQLGYVSFLNISKGHQTSVAINARPDIQSLGASAEWIVEMVSPDLPAFDPVTFNGCAAATDSHLIDLGPFGSALDIVTSDEVFLTQSTIASETSAIVRWEGWK